MKKHHVLFAVVGIANTAIDFLVLNIFAALLGFPTLAANIIAVSAAMTFSYLANQYLVFEPAKDEAKQVGRFLATNVMSGFIIQNVAIFSLTEVWTWPIMQVQSIVDALGVNVGDGFIETNSAKLMAVALASIFSWFMYKNYVFKGVKR